MGNLGRAGLLSGLLITAACGGDDDASPDAAAAVDAAAIDAEVAPDARPPGVTVTTLQRCCGAYGEPLAGATVFARAADGTLFGEGETAADGTLHFAGLDGGSVTAAFEADDLGEIGAVTYLGVELGDQLTFAGIRPPFAIGVPSTGAVTVTWPANAAAASFRVATSCGGIAQAAGGATSVSVALSELCDGATMDVQVIAMDGMTYPIAASYAGDAAFTDGGTITMPAFAAAPTFVWSAVDLPGDVTDAQFGVSSVVGGARGPGIITVDSPEAGAAGVSLPVAPGDDGYFVSAGAGRSGAAYQQRNYVVDGSTLARTFDGDDLLPWVTSVGYDRVTRTVSWTLEGGQAFDAHVVTISWDVGAKLFGPPEQHSWRIIAPPGAVSVTLPELPAALVAYEPPATEVLTVDVYAYDFAGVDGFAVARGVAEPYYVCSICTPLDVNWMEHAASGGSATIGVAK